MFIPSAILFVSLAHFASSKCEPNCLLIYAPVCGTDGNTYSNECMLNAERDCKGKPNLAVAHKGACNGKKPNVEADEPLECEPRAEFGACTREYSPLCGSDGKTYANKCLFCYNKHKLGESGLQLDMNHFGECTPDDYCPPSSKKGICTLEYAPVCANDGKTYATVCSMCAAMYSQQQAGEDIILNVVHKGICKEPRISLSEILCDSKYKTGICTKEFFPLCGSDGKTYANTCLFCYNKFQKQENGEDLTLNHIGKCKIPLTRSASSVECKESDKTGKCTDEYFPICGSNGETYPNRCNYCYAKFKAEENGEELTVDHIGKCYREAKCPKISHDDICPAIYAPVCSNEGKTYDNECLLCADMHHRQSNGENIHLHIVHDGKC